MNNRGWLNLFLIAGVLLAALGGFVGLAQAAPPAVALQTAEPTVTKSDAAPTTPFSPEQIWPVEAGHNLPSPLFAGRPLLAFTPSLTVTKHAVNDGDTTLRPGEQMTYTIAISNGGDTPATGVVVSDTFPAAMSYVDGSIAITPTSAGGTAGSPLSQPTLASDITVAAGSVVTVSYEVVVDPDVAHGMQITNTAAVTSAEDATPVTATIITPVANEVNLSISKSNGQSAVIPGLATTYTITVTNAGPGDVTGAVVTDTFPSAVSDITWTCVGTGGGSCPPDGSGDIDAVVDIPAAAQVTFSAAGQVGSGATGTLANTAWVSPPAGVSDLTPDNNDDSDDDPLTPQADLEITKTAGPDPVTAGQEITYTLVITNNGPSDAVDVQVTDDLPTGVSYVSAAMSGGSCDYDGDIVTCDRTGLVDGAAATVTIRGLVASSFEPGLLSNTASASSGTPDPVPGNDSDSVSTTVQRQADLVVAKTASPSPVTAGTDLTYTVVVTNNGPSDATAVNLVDFLPTEVSLNSAIISPPGGSCTTGTNTVNCPLGTISSGYTATVTLNVSVLASTPAGTLENDASATTTTNDPNPLNNSTTIATQVQRQADLEITKTAGPDPVTAGQEITYTLVITNNGPSDAVDVQVTDDLPTGVSYVSAAMSGGSCDNAGDTVTCDRTGLVDGATATVTIRGLVASSFEPGLLSNTASVSSGTPDPVPSNDSDIVSTTVQRQADLMITKSDEPDPMLVQNLLTYTIWITNNGPSDAANVQVADTLPTGVSYVSAAMSGGSCSHSGGTVTCNLGGLTLGSSAPAIIVIRPQTTGTKTNNASVSSSATDPFPDNNSAGTTTTVNPKADVSINKTVIVEGPLPLNPPVAGRHSLLYTLVVNNFGPSAAAGVTVTDTLPSGVDFISVASSDTSDDCSHNGGVVSCTLGTLDPSSLATISIRVAINPSATGTLINHATVTSTTADETSGNNNSSASTVVATRADLVLTKADSPDPVLAGNPLNYTLTITNIGPSDAAGVVVSDTLPASVTFSSASSGCGHSAGVVTCNLGSLARDEVKTVSIVVVPGVVGGVSNSASVSSATTDPDTANNSDTEPTMVNPKADLLIQKSAALDPVTAGETLTYTLLVINNGPSPASGITVVDNLPAEVNYVSATSNKGTCTYAGGAVSCSLNNLLTGENATVTIAVTVKLSFSGALANTASVAGNEADPNTANNTASRSTTVRSPDEYLSYLPLVIKPAPMTHLYIHNDNTGGQVQFTVQGTGVSCTVANNEVKFCGSFPPGTYVVQAVTSTCGTATTTKTYAVGVETTRVFCN